MARIDRFTSRIDAEVACSVLVAHGFDARVSTDDAGGLHPDIPYGIGGTAVVVPDEQYTDAVALLDASPPETVEVGPRDGRRGLQTLVLVLVILVVVTLVVVQVTDLFG